MPCCLVKLLYWRLCRLLLVVPHVRPSLAHRQLTWPPRAANPQGSHHSLELGTRATLLTFPTTSCTCITSISAPYILEIRTIYLQKPEAVRRRNCVLDMRVEYNDALAAEMDKQRELDCENGLSEKSQSPPPAYDTATAKGACTVSDLAIFDPLPTTFFQLTCLLCRTLARAPQPPKMIFPEMDLMAKDGEPGREVSTLVCI